MTPSGNVDVVDMITNDATSDAVAVVAGKSMVDELDVNSQDSMLTGDNSQDTILMFVQSQEDTDASIEMSSETFDSFINALDGNKKSNIKTHTAIMVSQPMTWHQRLLDKLLQVLNREEEEATTAPSGETAALSSYKILANTKYFFICLLNDFLCHSKNNDTRKLWLQSLTRLIPLLIRNDSVSNLTQFQKICSHWVTKSFVTLEDSSTWRTMMPAVATKTTSKATTDSSSSNSNNRPTSPHDLNDKMPSERMYSTQSSTSSRKSTPREDKANHRSSSNSSSSRPTIDPHIEAQAKLLALPITERCLMIMKLVLALLRIPTLASRDRAAHAFLTSCYGFLHATIDTIKEGDDCYNECVFLTLACIFLSGKTDNYFIKAEKLMQCAYELSLLPVPTVAISSAIISADSRLFKYERVLLSVTCFGLSTVQPLIVVMQWSKMGIITLDMRERMTAVLIEDVYLCSNDCEYYTDVFIAFGYLIFDLHRTDSIGTSRIVLLRLLSEHKQDIPLVKRIVKDIILRYYADTTPITDIYHKVSEVLEVIDTYSPRSVASSTPVATATPDNHLVSRNSSQGSSSSYKQQQYPPHQLQQQQQQPRLQQSTHIDDAETKVFITRLNTDFHSEERLRVMLQKLSPSSASHISTVIIPRKGMEVGYAFVTYTKREYAYDCISDVYGKTYDHRLLIAEETDAANGSKQSSRNDVVSLYKPNCRCKLGSFRGNCSYSLVVRAIASLAGTAATTGICDIVIKYNGSAQASYALVEFASPELRASVVKAMHGCTYDTERVTCYPIDFSDTLTPTTRDSVSRGRSFDAVGFATRSIGSRDSSIGSSRGDGRYMYTDEGTRHNDRYNNQHEHRGRYNDRNMYDNYNSFDRYSDIRGSSSSSYRSTSSTSWSGNRSTTYNSTGYRNNSRYEGGSYAQGPVITTTTTAASTAASSDTSRNKRKAEVMIEKEDGEV